MKCIKFKTNELIERVTDTEAHALVAIEKIATYIPRKEWKEKVRDAQKK